MKAKEPKQPKEKKKGEAKPRKSGDKSKRILAQAADPSMQPHAQPSTLELDPSVNGAADARVVATLVETAAGDGHPSEEMIRVRAYELFVQRGYEHGHHFEDWLAAERELKSR